MTRAKILGVPIDLITFDDLLGCIGQWVELDDGLHQICTVNPEFIIIAQQDAAFYQVLHRADLCAADGVGVVLALRLRGIRVPQRVTGSDGVPMIAERAAQLGWRIYLLGAGPGIAEQAAQILTARYPGLQIVGTYAGSPQPDEAADIIGRVNAAEPDILLVAYGAPAQDQWIDRYRADLRVKVAMGIGGSLDFVTGKVKRAPRFMQRMGLEWLYRLYLQPWRWRRMLRLPIFATQAMIRGERPPAHADH